MVWPVWARPGNVTPQGPAARAPEKVRLRPRVWMKRLAMSVQMKVRRWAEGEMGA